MKNNNVIIKLYKEHRELAILEWFYLFIAIAGVFVAGILALFNQAAGVAILIVPLIAIIAFAMNMICWAVIRLAIEGADPSRKTPEKKK